MKKHILITILLLVLFGGYRNELKAKAPADSLDYNNKELEEMMNQLSPEERKQVEDAMKLGKEMHEKGITPTNTSGDALKIPKRQDKILSEIPTISSMQQYVDYLNSLLADCKKFIDPSVMAEVDNLISKNSSNAEATVNLGPLLFLQKSPAAAIYAALKTAIAKPDNILIQDNLAVILHQAGYPHKSLPILLYLLPGNNYAAVLNNLAQAYLTLGDAAKAKFYFMSCLQKDPDHCEANCGMGLILTEEGNISEATPYIIKSLKNGYTSTADALVQKYKIDIKYSDIKEKVPEYFNPQKYKPIPPAPTADKVEEIAALREAFHEKTRLWMQKKAQINEGQNNKSDAQSFQEGMTGIMGLMASGPFAKKSQLMVRLIGLEYSEFVAADYKNQYLAKEKKYRDVFDQELAAFYNGGDGKKTYENEFEQCKRLTEILNKYLLESKKIHEEYQAKTLPKIYDWVNQSLYWWFFLSSDELYKTQFVNFVSDFFETIHEYDELQTLQQGEYIVKKCKDVKEPVKVKLEEDTIDVRCPINIKAPVGLANFKISCKGWELDGGELLMIGIDKDFKSGEFTFAFGLGGAIPLPYFELGAKGQMFFRFDKDFSPTDCGMKFEAGGEINVMGVNAEEKITATIGMVSGIHIDQNHMGKDIAVWKLDPRE